MTDKTTKYTKESIRTMLIKAYRKNNRRLTIKELTQLSKTCDEFPSISTIYKYFETTRISEVWEQIEDVEKNRINTSKLLLEQVVELAKKLGKTPSQLEFELSGKATYIFGSWNNFITRAGLKPNTAETNFSLLTKQQMLEIVDKEFKRIGSKTTGDYMKHKSDDAPSYYFILKILEVDRWSSVLKMLENEPVRGKRQKKKKEVVKCKVEQCAKVAKSKGYCGKHYNQIKRYGHIKEEKTSEELETHIEKMRSREKRVDNKLGVKGVRLAKSGKYQARIIVNYKEKHLGTYNTLEEAIQARKEGEKKYWGKIYTEG